MKQGLCSDSVKYAACCLGFSSQRELACESNFYLHELAVQASDSVKDKHAFNIKMFREIELAYKSDRGGGLPLGLPQGLPHGCHTVCHRDHGIYNGSQALTCGSLLLCSDGARADADCYGDRIERILPLLARALRAGQDRQAAGQPADALPADRPRGPCVR